MSKKRDSETGRYLGFDDAAERDRKTWVEETDFNKNKFLKEVFAAIIEKALFTESGSYAVKGEDIEAAFEKFGVKVTSPKDPNKS
jgi:hypothetical protein